MQAWIEAVEKVSRSYTKGATLAEEKTIVPAELEEAITQEAPQGQVCSISIESKLSDSHACLD